MGQTASQKEANTDETQSAPVPTTNGFLKHKPFEYRPVTIKEAPVENFRPLRVICVGAGYSGIYLAIRIPQRLRNVQLTVYEKNADVGGAWYENRYPGCACDIPAHSYQYSFNPNPNWSHFYAPAKEIHAYLKGVAQKYSATRFIKCSREVKSCIWDEEQSIWRVTVKDLTTGETFEDQANVLINARGSLNNINWPEIPGMGTFKGKIVHSAAWEESYDYSNKRIGVIGGGSSAIQIIPNIQKLPGTHISSFQRQRTWIAAPFGEHAMEVLQMDHDDFRPDDYAKFIQDPAQYLKFRKVIEADGNGIHAVSFKDSELQKSEKEKFRQDMIRRLSKKPEIAEHLIPSFGVGCRRATPGTGYLEALCEDNVDYITTAISHLSENSIHLVDGTSIPLDVLVCATGFKTSAPPPFPIIGPNNQSISDRWTPHPESYLSVTCDPFPNFFMMLGPNGAIGSGSLTMMIETYGDYITKTIRKMQKEDIKSMTIKRARVKDFQSLCKEYFKRTVYMGECRSWYRSDGGKGDMIIALWPGSTLHAIETLRSPRWEDFEYEYENQPGEDDEEDNEVDQTTNADDPNVTTNGVQVDGSTPNTSTDRKKKKTTNREPNLLRFLGNGWSNLQISEPLGDLAYYLEPDLQDIPAHPLPEKTWEYEKRCFAS